MLGKPELVATDEIGDCWSQVCSQVVSISNITLKGQTRGMLGKQSMLWPTSVSQSWPSSFWTSSDRWDRQLLSVCNTLFLSM